MLRHWSSATRATATSSGRFLVEIAALHHTRGQGRHRLLDGIDVCGRGATAATHDVHQSFGCEEVGGTTILNAATGYALLDWEEGSTRVLEMHRLVEGGNFWDSP